MLSIYIIYIIYIDKNCINSYLKISNEETVNCQLKKLKNNT